MFFQTTLGKLFLAILFGLVLYVSIGKNFLIAPILIFFCSIFYSKRIYILAAVTVFGWFFFDSLFNFIRLNLKENQVNLFHAVLKYQNIVIENKMLCTKIATIIVLFSLFCILYFYSFFQKKVNPTMYLLIITSVTICTTLFFHQQSWPAVYALTLSCCLMKFIWFLGYYLTDAGSVKKYPLEAILSIEPIWIFNFHRVHAVPRGSRELIASEQTDAVNLSKCQISGIKLALVSMIFKLTAQLLEQFIFNSQGSSVIFNYIQVSSLNLVNPNLIGLVKYNQLDISLFQLWSVVLVKPFIYFLFEPIGNAGLLIAFLRLLGFKVGRNFYRPHQATTFSNFLHRVYFYYSNVLIHFFYLPIFIYLSELNFRSKLKIFMGTFLTISVGGFVMSYFRNNILLIELGASNLLHLTLLKMPYLFIIAFFAAVSNIAHSSIKLSQYLRVGFFYFLYCVAFSMQGYLVTDSFADIVHFFLKLSTLGYYAS